LVSESATVSKSIRNKMKKDGWRFFFSEGPGYQKAYDINGMSMRLSVWGDDNIQLTNHNRQFGYSVSVNADISGESTLYLPVAGSNNLPTLDDAISFAYRKAEAYARNKSIWF